MKRIAAASTTSNKLKAAAMVADSALARGEQLGYDISVDVKSGTISVSATTSDKLMPNVSIDTQLDDGVIKLVPTLTFPKLSAADLEFHDDIQHYIATWNDVGKWMTQICQFEFDPDAWEYDEDNDEWYTIK